jgi:hypothetical protein
MMPQKRKWSRGSEVVPRFQFFVPDWRICCPGRAKAAIPWKS